METVGNPDRNQYAPITLPEDFWGYSIKELRDKIGVWQDHHMVGFSNWEDPTVYKNGEAIGYFSYNLRLWELPMCEPQVELNV